MMNSPVAQRNMPPLPPATMVIDMRGEGEDIISMLEVEIKNLADEMKQQNVRLWSSLADFISFKALDPIGEDDYSEMNGGDQWPGRNASSQSRSLTGSFLHSKSLTGNADQPDWTASFPPQFQTANQSENEDDLNDPTPPHSSFAGLADEIDRLRNKRINAVSDLGIDGTVGRNVKEPAVRVIFLADARHPNSLSTTASCATYLKMFYRRLERPNERAGQQMPINISVLCLNHQNLSYDQPPSRLIAGLSLDGRWDHLDSVILSEKYRQDIGRVDSDMQNLLAELLLYVLLIVSPSLARIRPGTPTPPREFDSELEDLDGQRVSLPPNTFLVGLSSIENSTRWGNRLLNCGLAEQTLQILLENNTDDEQTLAKTSVEHWMSALKAQVNSALPDNLPTPIPAMHVLTTAANAVSTHGVFSNSELSLQGRRNVQELEQYLDKVVTTYEGAGGSSTLHDAVLSIPQATDALSRWNSKEPETPLVQAQLMAHRVLADDSLFRGPRGAILRARLQLKELALAGTELQSKRRQKPLDIKAMQEELQKKGQERIDALKNHVGKWPFFAAFLKFKTIMARITTVLTLLLCFILVILSFSWLDQISKQVLPSVSNFLNLPLFGIPVFTSFYLLLILVFLLLMSLSIFVFGRFLADTKRSALVVEITLGLVLVAIALSGLLIWLSYEPLGNGALLAWYPPFLLSWISSLAFFIALGMAIVEAFHFSWWRRELVRERENIAVSISTQHKKNIQEINSYIVDTLLLHLLTQAGLYSEKAGPASYQKCVDDLNHLMTNTYTYAREERKLAESRLGSNLSDASLHIRQELLDVAALKRGYKRLGAALVYKREELRDLTEILLRIMGQEPPDDIERQFRENAPAVHREPYFVQVLMNVLTSVAIRFSAAMPASDMLTSLKERYEELDEQVTSQLGTLLPLVEALEKKIKMANLDEDEEGGGSALLKEFDLWLATHALAAWGQTLWEKKDHELHLALAPGGVIAKLMRNGFSPQTIKQTLGIRTSPSGRSLFTGLHDELYLFAAPSPESRKFLKDFLPERYIADFPDPERLLLMHIQHYIARPMLLQQELGSGAQPPTINSTLDSTLDSTLGTTTLNTKKEEDSSVNGMAEPVGGPAGVVDANEGS